MMEGISQRGGVARRPPRSSPNLCWIYDNNHITIEGHTELAFTEDVATRFIGYGWNVTRVGDANDLDDARSARSTTFQDDDRPADADHRRQPHRLRRSHKQDTHAAHGEPLGEEEIKLTKQHYGWPEDAKFLVPDGVYEHFAQGIGARGSEARADVGRRMFAAYGKEFPELADELDADAAARAARRLGQGPADVPRRREGPRRPRRRRGKVLNAIAKNVPWLIGGSADLAPSTKTRLTFDGAGDFESATLRRPQLPLRHPRARDGRRPQRHGAVEAAAVTARASSIFSDYARPAIRLAALMEIPVIHVFTHDSIGVGEDGPTHQPIEQLASLRAIPGLIVLRPGDANEVAEAWKRDRAVAPPAGRARADAPGAADARPHEVRAGARASRKGAYVLADQRRHARGAPDRHRQRGLAVRRGAREAHRRRRQGRVVSMPSWELFEQQDAAYRDSVLPPAVTARVVVEQASNFGWERYVGRDRRDDHDADVRRVGAAQGPAEEVRLRARQHRRRREGAARKEGSDHMQLGMIGLGRMGANMARRLMKAGHRSSSTIAAPMR